MKNLRRLTEGAGTVFERRLLESARDDASPPGSMSAVAARLGLELPATELQGSRGADHSVPAEAGMKNASSGALLKYTMIAIVCGSLGGGSTSDAALSNGVSLENGPLVASSKPDRTLASEAPRTTPEDDVIGDGVAFGADEPTRAPEAKSQLRAAAQRVPPSSVPRRDDDVRAPSASAPSAHGLLAEVRQLDRVRAALAAFQSQTALDALDDYERSFPRGELALEAIVLRVQALRSAGQFAPASRLARRALELPGIDRYRSRLARLIEPE